MYARACATVHRSSTSWGYRWTGALLTSKSASSSALRSAQALEAYHQRSRSQAVITTAPGFERAPRHLVWVPSGPPESVPDSVER